MTKKLYDADGNVTENHRCQDGMRAPPNTLYNFTTTN